jgi:hypothetical protein
MVQTGGPRITRPFRQRMAAHHRYHQTIVLGVLGKML